MRPDAVNISAPFGGLHVDAARMRDVDPRHCSDCRNSDTSRGNIALRPGSLPIRGGTINEVGLMMKSVAIGQKKYLYVFDQQIGGSRHLLYNDGFALFPFASPSADSPAIVPFGGKLLCVTGSPGEGRKIYEVGGVLTAARIGIDPPVSAPTLNLTAGTLSGTFNYRYTYYNASSGTESGPSADAAASPSAQGVQIIMVDSPDPQVTHFRIYRREDGTDGTWYFLRQEPVQPVVDSNGTVTRLLEDALNFTAGLPPRSNVACLHRNRVWYKDVASGYYGSDVWYSDFDRPEQVYAGNQVRFGYDPKDYLVALHSAFGVLLGFNTKSIWAVSGYDPSSFVTTRIVGDVGCISANTIVEIDNWVYFAGSDGVYRFNGSSLECLSTPDNLSASRIGLLSDWFTPAAQLSLTAAFDPLTYSYVLAGNGRVDGYALQLAYHVRTRNWQRWNIPCTAVCTHDTDIAQGGRMFFAAWKPGNPSHKGLGLFGTSTTNTQPVYTEWTGENVALRWRTPRMGYGTARRKRFFFTGAAWHGGSAGGQVTLRQSLDGGAMQNVLTAPQDSAVKRIVGRMASRAHDVAIEIETSGFSNSGIEIQSIEPDAQRVGKR